MGFFDSIKRLFGEGKARFEGETKDQTFSGKMPYIGTIESEEELIQIIYNTTLVEYGKYPKWIRIVAINGTGVEANITGRKFYF